MKRNMLPPGPGNNYNISKQINVALARGRKQNLQFNLAILFVISTELKRHDIVFFKKYEPSQNEDLRTPVTPPMSYHLHIKLHYSHSIKEIQVWSLS